MGNNTRLPSDVAVRFRNLPPGTGEHRFTVLLACLPQDAPTAAFSALLAKPGVVTACLTHNPGLSWPDAVGEQMALAALDRRSIVILRFTNLEDALRCKRRAEEARR